MEDQEAKLRETAKLDPDRLYRDELSAARAKRPSHIQPEWLTERAVLLKPTARRGGEAIRVATLLALAVNDGGDLLSVLRAAERRNATIIAADSGLSIEPGEGLDGANAAATDWQRAKKEAQTRPGRAEGNRVAAEKRRERTMEKLKPARPLWRDTKPTRLSAEQVSEQVGLSIRTLYAELGRRPEIKKGRSK